VSLRGYKRWIAQSALVTVVALGVTPGVRAEDRKLKSDVRAVYPELAKKMNVGGTVRVEVVITPAGTVKSAKALGGHPLLIEPSVDAAKRMKFEAAAAETTQVMTFEFKKPNQ
jgi:TonB family protein